MHDLTRGEKIFRNALYVVIALLVLGTGLMVAVNLGGASNPASAPNEIGPTAQA